MSTVQFDFLNTEADLAMTFLQTAAIEAQSDPAHADRAIALAVEALVAIRKFLPKHPFTPGQITHLEERCAVIEDRIRQLREPNPLQGTPTSKKLES